MPSRYSPTFVSALLVALGLVACSSQPPTPEQDPAGVESRTPGDVSSATTTVQTPTVTTQPIDPLSPAALKDPRSILSKRNIYFDYDSFVVRDEYKPLIEAHARFLVANPKMRLLIQGNADERGSREYNLALGQKRADAIRRALLLLGAREEQIEAVSLGEEKPRCTEATESCWAENRRGDLLYAGEY